MFEDLSGIEDKYLKLEAEMGDPEVVRDQKLYQKAARQHSELAKIVNAYRRLKKSKSDLEEARELMSDGDAEIRKMAHSEIEELEVAIEEQEQELKILLLPKDPNDDKNIVSGDPGRYRRRGSRRCLGPTFFVCTPVLPRSRRWKVDSLKFQPHRFGWF